MMYPDAGRPFLRKPLEELHTYALTYRTLGEEAVADLAQAGFSDPAAAREAMAAELADVVVELGVVQKCNAVIVVVVAAPRHNPDLIRQRTLDCWDRRSSGGVLPILPKIVSSIGVDAAQFEKLAADQRSARAASV
jgi:hypothetical protein